MPSLKDLADVTGRVDKLTSELHAELTEGSVDFRKMVALADDIGDHVDRLAAAFATMADALDSTLDGKAEQPADAAEPSGEPAQAAS
jgi:chemotaxis regulatin CheY-phosphate phosphatase CheZ